VEELEKLVEAIEVVQSAMSKMVCGEDGPYVQFNPSNIEFVDEDGINEEVDSYRLAGILQEG